MELKISISPVNNKYVVLFEGGQIGFWKDPECSAARYLLDKGLASGEDVLHTWLGDRIGMSGRVGWFAERRVRETETLSPTFVKWTPFPVAALPRRTASDDVGD